MIGPTLDLAPADRKLFFVRDVTATVESVPLITGSIISKKLAVAPRGLTITVGSGSGAYMPTIEDARRLAGYMAEVAARVGVPSVMLLTDLDSVLGSSVGNAVGVQETVDFLLGRHRDGRVLDLVLSVVAEMVALAGVERDPAAARRLAQARLEDGSATERFARMVKALGGPGDFVEKASAYLPAAPVVRPVLPETAGFVSGMDAGRDRTCAGGARRRPQASRGRNRPVRRIHRIRARWRSKSRGNGRSRSCTRVTKATLGAPRSGFGARCRLGRNRQRTQDQS